MSVDVEAIEAGVGVFTNLLGVTVLTIEHGSFQSPGMFSEVIVKAAENKAGEGAGE